jgi:hypothetical protein
MNNTAPLTHSPSPDLIEIYNQLRLEVSLLTRRWHTHKDLFKQKPKRVELLNKCAGQYFVIVQWLQIEEVLVCLSKLTDPASTGKNENLSLNQLQLIIGMNSDAQFVKHCQVKLDKVDTNCKDFRLLRNKVLAHLDLPTALNPSGQYLPSVSHKQVDVALRSVVHYMDTIATHFGLKAPPNAAPEVHGGAGALLRILKAGLRYEELVKLKSIPRDDLAKGAWHDA